MKNRDYCFCRYVCDQMVESDNNSWGDVSCNYVCKAQGAWGRTRIRFEDWNEEEVPKECKFKLEYQVLNKESIDKLADIYRHKKNISKCEEKKLEFKKQMDEEDEKIAKYTLMIKNLENDKKLKGMRKV